MSLPDPYVIRASRDIVEVWSGYQIQFDGMRRFAWQDELVRDLKDALARMVCQAGDALSAVYNTTVGGRCDVENRLFTNPGAATFPVGTTAIRWERGVVVPPSPTEIDAIAGMHYYRYSPGAGFSVWQPDRTVARWSGVERRLAHDGSARPMWLALREAVFDGRVEILPPPIENEVRFGLSIEVRAPRRGPRSAPAISEALVDGALCALHAGATVGDAPGLASALAKRLASVEPTRLLDLVTERAAALAGSPFKLSGSRAVQLSPADEFCDAGEVRIVNDPSLAVLVTSAALFTLRAAGTTSSG